MNKILLAEDENMLSLIIKDALEIKNYNVAIAKNGNEALELFNTFKPNLVILDIMMPLLGGYEVAKKIRLTDSHIPIVFLSAKSQTQDVLKGFETGANDYIKKPFSIDELMARVSVLIKMSLTQNIEHLVNTPSSLNISTKNSEVDYVFMKEGNKLLKVNFSDITYLQAEKDYTTLFRGDKKTLISSHLKELEAILPKHKFIRVHRSYIVAISAITALKRDALEIDKKEIPIGNNYKQELFQQLNL